MIAHIVLFRPKEAVTPLERSAFAEALERACRDAPTVRRALVGQALDVGAGYLGGLGSASYSHAAVFEFENRDGLVGYLRHPAHTALSELFWRTCESTVILDVEVVDVRVEPAKAI